MLNLGSGVNVDQAIDLLAPALDLWSKALRSSGSLSGVHGYKGSPKRSGCRQRLLLDYPIATAPIEAALGQVFQLLTNPLSKNP